MTLETFEGFGLPAALQSCLTQMKFTIPTPIQVKAIPFALEGRDILGSAQTGTGKTAAFSIPMIAALMEDPRATALVLTPTRELAIQVLDVARQMIARDTGIRTALLIGGEPMGKQFRQLEQRARLIVGTPGRVNDHLRRNPDMLEQVRFVVLDEADRMLDMGFTAQIDTILDRTPDERQTLMFSATFAPKILKFAQTYLKNPQRVEIQANKVSADNIAHQFLPVAQEKKYDALRAELETRTGTVIVFMKTKHSADKMAKKLVTDGHQAAALHGGLNQRQRERITRQFRGMEHRILVATDVAARGLDIPHVEHVINYDMPMVAEDYIHRIGRTARAGAKGSALAIVSPQDNVLWRDVERLLNPRKKEEQGERRPHRDDGDRKSFRKGPFGKKPASRNEGFRKEGFQKREDRDGGFKKEGFKGDGFRKNSSKKPFQKRERSDDFFGDRPVYADRAPNEKPFRKRPDGDQRFTGKERNGNNDRDHGRSFTEGRPAQGKKPFHKRPDGEKRYFDERGPKKFAGKPSGNKSGKRYDAPSGDAPRKKRTAA